MKSKYTALLAGWLVPGLGHFYAGRKRKGTIFFVAIMSSAITGLVLGDWRNVYFALTHFQFYAEIGNGLFTVAACIIMKITGAAPVEATASAAEMAGRMPIADLYLMVAGLLNLVVAANAFDTVAADARDTK